MQLPVFSKNEAAVLAGLAVFGFLVPNGAFLYWFVRDPGLLRAALANPIALMFILEALFLTGLFAWLLHRAGVRRPSGLVFLVVSVAGSLAFSVPATLWLLRKNQSRPDA